MRPIHLGASLTTLLRKASWYTCGRGLVGGIALNLFWSFPAFAWQQYVVTDHLRGKVGIGVRVTRQMEDERGRKHAGEFVVNCSNNSTTMYVGSTNIFVGGDSARVAWTLDEGPIQQAHWHVCVDNQCAGPWHGGGIPFVKSLYGKSMLKITIRRYDNQLLAGTFFIGGNKEATEPVGQLCGWIPKH